MKLDKAKEEFLKNFKNSNFSYIYFDDFKGYLVNVSTGITPKHSMEEMFECCVNNAKDICIWLHQHNILFEDNDRIQIIVGYDESVKKPNRQIIKGCVPANNLKNINSDIDPLDYSSIGGSGSSITNGWEKNVYTA